MNAPEQTLELSEVKVRLADGTEPHLVAWASVVVNGCLHVNNIAVRRALDGRLVLAFPAKKSRQDVKYFHVKPITQEAAAVFDRAILGALARLAS